MSPPFVNFRDRSIRSKVMLVTCAASLVAIFAVAGGLYLFQLRHFRHTFQSELVTLARIMADNCATALAFKDPKTANEVLDPLKVKPEITRAVVFDLASRPFANFSTAKNAPAPKAPATSEGIADRGASWSVAQPIIFDGERIGTLLLEVDYAQPRAALQRLYLWVTVVVLGGSTILVLLLTLRLQRFITQPVQSLAHASEAVARDHDYSVRVASPGNDELGRLTAAFNHMLARIEEQDTALHSAGEELQSKVAALEAEITERKAAEARVADLNRQLVDTSRQAGMAEVATGVLHNVGNVLNSVNIASSTVIEKLRASKVEGLAKASALLASREADLAEFLINDAQGKRLPGYLRKLAGILVEENASMRGELEQLGGNIEHIKEIVAMQQSYARATGFLEDVSADKLVEDALQLNTASFSRHGIDVARDFQPVPAVRVDKHKVLQILINLIRNAKHAVEDAQQPAPRISIALQHESDRVRIVVSDNGVGIAPDHLTSVFRHGFTTKKNGHGFGLHSGANAAREMGGTLTATSPGTGFGATFTLELPTAPAASHP